MDSQQWTVYIDGSAFPNPGRMQIGGIAYAPDGSAHRFSQALAAHGCNNEAEALAAIHALQWLQAQHAQQVLLHTDNSILAEQLGRAQPKRIERLAAVYAQARTLLAQFDEVQVQWIPRHKNATADALARGAAPAGS
ncbi:ribonuclease HI family protein [Comamonas antarctica]|uniref:Ribonuclease HI family protein n=1 Tax=Comamonas antarctica TaxID=2743470 RepID=A0A6N1X7G1_9BURK|nr:ribonuclease HI family protein [Comamonas antarctica]QKV55344.1 ribonuclease HI family protein [Comamonas antarctica]